MNNSIDMAKYFVVLLSLVYFLPSFGQDKLSFPSNERIDSTSIVSYLNSSIEGQGTVHMVHEPLIDSIILLSKQVLEQNGEVGYAVQLFRGNNGQISRRSAEKIKSEYLKINPEGKINVVYSNPNWRVHVGNYRTYAEALRIKMQLEKQLPQYADQIYIVRIKLQFSDS